MKQRRADISMVVARAKLLGRLKTAHTELQRAMTELVHKKDYAEAERLLRIVDKLMLDLIEEHGGRVVLED